MKKHCMIDIETTGLIANCRILSIGAVLFDETGLDTETFYVAIDPMLWGKAPYRDRPDTITWWEQQDPIVRMQAFGGTESPLDALSDLREWLTMHDPATIWAKGASFDIAIIDYWLDFYDIDPLRYSGKRCMRGWLELAGVEPVKIPDGQAHNALADARYQAMGLHAAITALKAWDQV